MALFAHASWLFFLKGLAYFRASLRSKAQADSLKPRLPRHFPELPKSLSHAATSKKSLPDRTQGYAYGSSGRFRLQSLEAGASQDTGRLKGRNDELPAGEPEREHEKSVGAYGRGTGSAVSNK
jgi:hypothetical protein